MQDLINYSLGPLGTIAAAFYLRYAIVKLRSNDDWVVTAGACLCAFVIACIAVVRTLSALELISFDTAREWAFAMAPAGWIVHVYMAHRATEQTLHRDRLARRAQELLDQVLEHERDDR